MPDRDNPLITLEDVATALALLTRLPISRNAQPGRGAAAAWAYPLVGIAAAIPAALVAAIAGGIGLPPALIAGLVLLTLITTTGALHEDGLADSADGIWGAWTPQKRLEIMKDSHIGTYGVIALVLSLGLRWAAIAAIAANGALFTALVVAAVLSRAPMVVLMHLLPNARATGMSKSVGRPSGQTTLLALAIALAVGLLLGYGLIPLMLVLPTATFAIAAAAKRKIKGQTGDILGATQQISEIIILGCIAL